jgi:hypothetical protein
LIVLAQRYVIYVKYNDDYGSFTETISVIAIDGFSTMYHCEEYELLINQFISTISNLRRLRLLILVDRATIDNTRFHNQKLLVPEYVDLIHLDSCVNYQISEILITKFLKIERNDYICNWIIEFTGRMPPLQEVTQCGPLIIISQSLLDLSLNLSYPIACSLLAFGGM